MAFKRGRGVSRFAVLAKDGVEAPTGKRVLNISSQLTKPPKIPVLVEISNRESSRKKHVPLTASKYRVFTGTNKGLLNRPLKENLSGINEGTISKSINKGKQISTEMEEDLEDSDVLKISYTGMLEFVGAGNSPPSTSFDGHIFGPGEGQIGSDDLGNGIVEPLPPRLVDVSSAKDLDVVASNLCEEARASPSRSSGDESSLATSPTVAAREGEEGVLVLPPPFAAEDG
ncbi:hypothetical protein LWI29_005431 [Acer saccharum]|uniref:CHASE domain-containing protein n=1 Tax=Acer saccharum TaxID=4024 RepID=A0AA39RHL6_ACESA|nr:hypothetical protein LWI29_005431 [Acer saccharum]